MDGIGEVVKILNGIAQQRFCSGCVVWLSTRPVVGWWSHFLLPISCSFCQILSRAETVAQAEKESATDEFLAQFKTVSFKMDEERGMRSVAIQDRVVQDGREKWYGKVANSKGWLI